MISNIRNKLIRLQKRPRLPSEEQENIISDEHLAEQLVDEEAEQEQLLQFEKVGNSLWFEGFKYNRSTKKSQSYRCSERCCPATILLMDENLWQGKRNKCDHTHLPMPEKQAGQKKKIEFKQTIRENPMMKRRQLTAKIRDGAGDETFMEIGNDNALGVMFHREKKKIYGNVNTKNILKMNLPKELIEKEGVSILLYDSRTRRLHDPNVVLVFAFPRLLQILSSSSSWALDGTFSSAPTNFKQIFTIGAFIQNRIIICGHALLTKKETYQYEESLAAIAEEIGQKKPQKVISDFEMAIKNATKNVFGDRIETNGCFFHLSKAMFSKIKEMGLQNVYLQDLEVRMTFRRLLSLALIPIGYINKAFYIIADNSPPSMAGFLYYFKKNYIGLTDSEKKTKSVDFNKTRHPQPIQRHFQNLSAIHTSSNDNNNSFAPNCWHPAAQSSPILAIQRADNPIKRQPMFPTRFWNVNERAQFAIAKTNNAMEASHFQFAKNINTNPSMSDYLHYFWNDVTIQKDNARSAKLFLQKRKRKFVIREANIAMILQEAIYDSDENILNALNLLAHQIQSFTRGFRNLGEKRIDENDGDGIPENEFLDEENDYSEEEIQEEEIDVLNDENSPTDELLRDIKAPLIRSAISTLDVPSSSNISSDLFDHTYDA